MPKFRKKPLVIEAEQYRGPNEVHRDGELPVCPPGVRWERLGSDMAQFPYVVTKQGQKVHIKSREWVAKEMDGTGYYPIAPDTFEATYEPAE